MNKYHTITVIENRYGEVFKPGDYIEAKVVVRKGCRLIDSQMYYGEIVDISGNKVTVEADPDEDRGIDGVFDLEQVEEIYTTNRPEERVESGCSGPDIDSYRSVCCKEDMDMLAVGF